MKLAKEVFVKQTDSDKYLIYSPLNKKINVVNAAFLSRLKDMREENLENIPASQKKMFQDAGVLVDNENEPKPLLGPFKPTTLTVFPTSDCNLRCVYCYGNAGVTKKTVDINIVKSGIDLIVKNAAEMNVTQISLGFHGGGEPTFAWPVLTESVDYAKIKANESGLRLKTGISTNGVLKDEQINWIIENIKGVQLSMDGPEEIQNKQRPLHKPSCPGFKSSYDAIMKTIQTFQERQADFRVRTTVTAESITQLEDIVRFFASEVRPKMLHLEPLFECGRCKTNKTWNSPNLQEIYDYFVAAEKTAEETGINLFTSLGKIDRVAAQFCGAAGYNFCITPEGYISSCYEVSLKEDPQSEVFFYGRFNPENQRFEIDEDKRSLLQSRILENMKSCQDCFIKWSCAGDCLVKVSRQGDLFDSNGSDRCKINKQFAKYRINQILDKEAEK